MTSEAKEIVQEIADEKGIDLDGVIIPDYKIESLWDTLDEEEFRNHFENTFEAFGDEL